MFRFLTIAFFVFAYLNVFSQQNFIITKNNFNVVPRVDTLAQLSSAAIQDFAKPTYGENQTWDYSGIITEGYRNTLSILLSTKLPNTQTDAFFIPNYFEVIAANRGYYFDEYSVVDESGFNVVGWGFDENQNYFIGDLTGNSADSIIFPKQYQTYKSPRVVLKFPSEYGSTHTSSFAKNLKFNLTLTGFGIINDLAKKSPISLK